MGRRKQPAPLKASSEKRQCMSWNMLDGTSDGSPSLSVINDNDPSLLLEQDNGEQLMKKANSHLENSHESLSVFSDEHMNDLFHLNLENCVFYLNISKTFSLKNAEWFCELGRFQVTKVENSLFPEGLCDAILRSDKFWLYVSGVPGKSVVYFELEENNENDSELPSVVKRTCFWFVNINAPVSCLESLQNNVFQAILGPYDDNNVQIIVYAMKQFIMKLRHPSEVYRPKKLNIAIQSVMSHFYHISPPDYTGLVYSRKHDIEELYSAVKRKHEACVNVYTGELDVQHSSLKPLLRPYQRGAVQWMLFKETQSIASRNDGTGNGELHELYTEIATHDGQTLYYNRYGGSVVTERQEKLRSPPGGILADEMGLGKTVEVLACMLLHPRDDLELPQRLPTLNEQEEAQKMDDDTLFVNTLETPSTWLNSEENSLSSTTVSWNSFESNVLGSTCNEDSLSSVHPLKALEGDSLFIESTQNSISASDVISQVSKQTILQDADHDSNVEPLVSNTTVDKNKSYSVEDSLYLPPDSQTGVLVQDSSILVGGKTVVHNSINMVESSETNAVHGSSYSDNSQDCTVGFAVALEGVSGEKLVNVAGSNIVTSLQENAEESVPKGRGIDITFTALESSMPVSSSVSSGNFIENESFPMQPNISEQSLQLTQSPNCDHMMQVSVSESYEESRHKEIVGLSVSNHPTNSENVSHLEKTREQYPQASEGTCSLTFEQSNYVDLSNISIDTESVGCEKSSGQQSSYQSSSDLASTDQSVNKSDIKPKSTKRRNSKVGKGFEEIIENEKVKSDFFCDGPVKQKEYFECVCGVTNIEKRSRRKHCVQCVKCKLWQHAECLSYDLNDPYRGDYKCPHCHVASTPISSGATLIISPFSICHQWVEEITKHIKQESLKVFVYTGVNKQGFIQPRTLARFDIVITTYETLRKEIDYVDLPHSNSDTGRKFRHPKRFMAIPSPIIAVEWWRICLDEAQMVECTTTKTAEMALRLSAINKWCVTGTPIQKGVEDVYGLLLFLGVDPYWAEMWWRKLVLEPFCYGIKEHMHNLLSEVLWRTAKKDVIEQIELPDQTEEVHWLRFSPVEDHFYRRQYKDCVREAMKKLSGWTDNSTRLNSLDRHTISQLLYPLLKLRQACCHPQAVRGEFLPIHQSTMTMEELLVSLTKKAKLECEESHRQLVAALNGLAGLHIIKNEYSEAVDLYREVLRSVKEHEELLRTDDLQLLHSMSNLNEVLTSKPEGVLPTLRDDLLKEQAADLKDKYMSKVTANTESTQEQLQPITEKLRELILEFQDGSEWWTDILQWVMDREMDEKLVDKIKEDLAEKRAPGMISLANRFRNLSGLEYILHGSLIALQSSHQKLLTAVRGLSCTPSMDVVNKTVECCLRPEKKELKTCPFCKAHELFEEYESKLFSFTDKGITSLGGQDQPQYQINTKRQGTWADSEVEKTLKCILTFCKQKRANPELVRYGTCHMSIFETMKKEFKCLRLVWMSLREQVSAIDELNMATTRLRFRLPDEPTPEVPQPNVLEPVEFDHHKLKLISERTIARNELKKKLGQLLYLKNLAKSQEEMSDGCNPEPCPICQKELGVEWSVLLCGHCFCLDCIKIMVDSYSFGGRRKSVRCAICRQPSQHGEISYVSTKPNRDDRDNIMGSHSTKVSGIVKCLLKILKAEPNAKALVFSSWTDVLDVISHACRENKISHTYLQPGRKFQNNLTSFKQCSEVNVLLLPVHSGANGLNLIEATHVLLVEPLLNPAQELQAVGRVHRIGQTRPTQVHHFLIRGTIEQKIHHMMKDFQTTSSTHEMDDNPLTIGDLSTLFQEDKGTGETEDENSVLSANTHNIQTAVSIDNSRVDEEQVVNDDQTPSTSGVPNTISVPDLEQWSHSSAVKTPQTISQTHTPELLVADPSSLNAAQISSDVESEQFSDETSGVEMPEPESATTSQMLMSSEQRSVDEGTE